MSSSHLERSFTLAIGIYFSVNDQRVDSQKSFEQILQTIERGDSFQLLVQRGTELLRVQIRP
jgi:hypothetical protein